MPDATPAPKPAEDGRLHTVCAACGKENRIEPARLAAASRQAKCGHCGEALISDHPQAIAQDRFDAFVGRSDIPILVDFWAPWCGPCRAMAPALDRAAMLLSPGIRVAKVNIDEAQQLAGRLNVQAVPTLALFRRGKELARTAGAMPEAALADWARKAAAAG